MLEVDIETLTEDDFELKFFIWGRKIEDEVEFLEGQNRPKEEIQDYLEKCASLREKFLDKNDLTETEEYYTDKIHGIFEEYQVLDPIF